jgi:hypothetical protein
MYYFDDIPQDRASRDHTGVVRGQAQHYLCRNTRGRRQAQTSSAALAKKYGIMRSLYHFIRDTRRMLQREAKAGAVSIAIEHISG